MISTDTGLTSGIDGFCDVMNVSERVRPYDMFVGTVMTEKGMKPRFEYLVSSYSDEPSDEG